MNDNKQLNEGQQVASMSQGEGASMNEKELLLQQELSLTEIEERVHHENVVDSVIHGISHLAQIGDASLKVLRDKRLYRSTHKTFEDYCQERFGISRQYANKRIVFSAMLEVLETRVSKLPETEKQARPLSKLPTPDLQAEAWTNAQAATGKDQPSASAVAQEVDKLLAELDAAKAEKSEIQSQLELAEQKIEKWREQANNELKKRRTAESAAELKATELKALNQSLEQTAKHLAAAQLTEIKLALDNAKLDKIEAEQKLTALKKEMTTQVETRTKQALKAQQDEIDRREAQLRTIELKITSQQERLRAIENRDRAAQHFEAVTTSIRQTMDALSLHLSHAFDTDYADHLPAAFAPAFERLATELESAARDVRRVLSQVEIRHLEMVVNNG